MNTKSLLIYLFELSEKGGLDKIEQKHIITALNSYGRSQSSETYELKFNRIREGVTKLLQQLESCIDSSIEDTEHWFDAVKKIQDTMTDLPEGADPFDDAETLKFIKSLTKEHYSFSDAERLIGASRQSIALWSKEGKYGLTTVVKGKRPLIQKKVMIEFYKAYNGKSEFPF